MRIALAVLVASACVDPSPPTIAGRINDYDGEPVIVRVIASSPEGIETTITDGEGEFRIELPASRYTVVVEFDGVADSATNLGELDAARMPYITTAVVRPGAGLLSSRCGIVIVTSLAGDPEDPPVDEPEPITLEQSEFTDAEPCARPGCFERALLADDP
jgi:hypothetical protein